MTAPDRGLYRDSYERDSCGFGLIASLDDQPSHWLIETAITSLKRLTHRGAIAAVRVAGSVCGFAAGSIGAFMAVCLDFGST